MGAFMINSGDFEKLYLVIVAFLVGGAIGFGCCSLFYKHTEVPVREEKSSQGTFKIEERNFNIEDFGPV